MQDECSVRRRKKKESSAADVVVRCATASFLFFSFFEKLQLHLFFQTMLYSYYRFFFCEGIGPAVHFVAELRADDDGTEFRATTDVGC